MTRRAGLPHGTHQAALAGAIQAVLKRLDGSDTAAHAPAGDSALASLCTCFGLTPFERDVLVLAAAAELDPTMAARCADASGDARRPYPTLSLALATLGEPHWSAITPVAPLRRWHLVELDDETSLTTTRLRADERILHFLAGVPYLDPRLGGLVHRIEPPADHPAAYKQVTAALAARWNWPPEGDRPHAEITGGDPRTRREIAAAAAADAGLQPYALRDADLPAEAAEREELARLWEREAILLPAVLLVEASRPAHLNGIAGLLSSVAVPTVVSSDDPLPGLPFSGGRLTVPALDRGEQLRLWVSGLGDALPGARALDGTEAPPGTGANAPPGTGPAALRQLVAQFSLPAHVIRAAAARVRQQVAQAASDAGPAADVGQLAWRGALAETRAELDELGQRVEPRAGWDDLVLPGPQRVVLDELTAHVRQRATVYEDWGFDRVLRRGLGVTALFAGGSGTGKSLTGEVIARELGLDLFVIDLSQVVSKYIGETEKHLRRVFDAAERGGAVLLFDEADALFGKRSEVKDSHDRYANIEVSYLLMRMEEYRGLAILTTNMKKALDQAFMRRLRFVVEFPFPGPKEREEIWRRVIPAQVPAADLDFSRLAQLTVAGGSIRNIALAGAFLAADEGAPLAMRHMLAAARTEYLKMERGLPPGEVAGWE